MSEIVKMPALGESVTEGTVVRWLKEVGEEIAVDEPLLEVSTDKVDTEVPSPVAGVLEKILVNEDEDAEIGADLAVVGDGSGVESSSAEPSEGENLASDPTVAPSTTQEAPIGESEAPGDSSSNSGSADGEEVKMPALGESVDSGTVVRWLKEVGEQVEADEPLLEVSTDKVDTEVPSPVAGTLQKILVQEDEEAEVGAAIAVIGSGAPSDASPAPAAPAAESASPAPKAEQSTAPAATASETVSSSGNAQAYVTPIVRKLASDNGIDLSSVKGSGIGGRIRKQDVQEAIEAKKKAEVPAPAVASAPSAAAPAKKEAPKVEVSPLRGTEEKMTRLRKIVASRMVESLQTQAQLTTAVEVDMTRIAALRGRAKNDFLAREGAKLTFLPFIMQAAVEALKAHPKLNAEIAGDMIKYHGVENIGMAADTERGLVVPVIKNAGDLNLAGLARQIGELGAKAKGNKLTPDDLQGATFTITNTGSGGALFDTPIVPNPQVGILGCGTIVKRPAVVKDADGNETIGIRSMMYLFLSYDHRLVDGGDAARFLSTMKKRLEDGAFEGDLGL
ncbi:MULTISPECIES: 2-oxoglutarate dehydrogenase, E2 component, dihydrolipoamide succinyltransferase [Dermabacter]|uniref:Dihydrolipoamide acetyltransferase component of pyruvate dehydrogenase complex n=1 Tax=Dermabacter vaginalis TaxID=1630135 RepID=A0A1B0ZI13_9MICO|nr:MULTISPECIES: 2-oxoglutarate dehydrogenase, E2 component, dihydrolipoamide succinyltransferase [Dermabacter]ANP27606.1 2-oxoglutarate dehydrogenase, E2 component, dihydrolipoamide succinyltransferase [Dermabacter vaginalis]MCG7442598.1 2-oxoglutarate dehydrogenase, E2 component, dihydrolipoamide succinyltransferase [Dermabacter vaginalis]QEU11977.1 2-oxoglutarate dehydrogenase, E2 component, dihydrolipoamide succinyltransferase [Dermabacter vaginalis]RUP87154.1 2-oxoglutarate dehydrogenase, 